MLREVSVPGYLEGFPVLLGRDASGLIFSPNTEWAERLSPGAARVLRDALSQRIGSTRVVMDGEGRIPDADLTIEFLALDPQGAALRLDARWFISCTMGSGHGGRTRLEVPIANATPGAVAAVTGEALARLAQTLAAEIACPEALAWPVEPRGSDTQQKGQP